MESNKSGGLGSIIMLLTLLVGGVALESQISLQGSRPTHDSKIHYPHIEEEDVDARLWQDPFQAVDQFIKSHSKEHQHDHGPSRDRWSKFNESLKLKLNKSEKIAVLGVMVSSGAYFVDAEDRIRTRYAVVSGLSASNYQPENSEYIGYIAGEGLHLPERLPYEWFTKDSRDDRGGIKKDHVLVLWLDARYFFHENAKGRKRPLKNIQFFFQQLLAEAIVPGKVIKQAPLKLEERDYSKFQFTVIGPPNSGQLGEMVNEVSHHKIQISENKDSEKGFPDYKIFSTRATKDEELILIRAFQDLSIILQDWESEIEKLSLLSKIRKENLSQEWKILLEGMNKKPKILLEKVNEESKIRDEGFQDTSSLSVGKYFKQKGINFLRTTPTDLELAQALVRELRLRGVTKNSPVALFSEWDTDYGRAFRETMCRAWNAFDWDEGIFPPEKKFLRTELDLCKVPKDNIYYFSYLRGLDGQMSERPAKEKKKSSKKNSFMELNLEPEDLANLRAERERQYDYLLRLAGEIKETEKNLPTDSEKMLPPMFQNPHFEAFGILGSDYYDKLVVLQALRKQFTHAHFFTTDMDARLFHARDYKYVRNLIVASGFGLQLRKDLQNSIPPFRDTYQTSAFLATQLALKHEEPAKQLTQDQLNEWLQPRVFEIGRTKAFDLSENKEIEDNFFQKPRKIEPTLHADEPTPNPDEQKLQVDERTLHPGKSKLIPGYKYPALGLLATVLLGLLYWKLKEYKVWIISLISIFGSYLIFLICADMRGTEEPLAFFEGVSLWPTDFFRLFGIIIAVGFIKVFRRKFMNGLRAMTKKFQHTRKAKKIDWLPKTGKEFRDAITFRAAAFIIVGFLALLTFGMPFTPVRGGISTIVDKIILGSFIFGFGLSLAYVGVKLSESVDLIKKFVPGQCDWTDKTADAVFKDLNFSATLKLVRPLLNDLISLRFIGLHTNIADELIYYPFGIIAIGILSRNRVFDSWDFPWPLLCIFGFGAIYILIKALQIQRNASKYKNKVLGRLQIRLIQYKAMGMEKEKELTQLLIADATNYKAGAFLPFMEHPFFKAMLLPFSGFGGMALLEYMFLAV